MKNKTLKVPLHAWHSRNQVWWSLSSCLCDKFCSSFQLWNPGQVVRTWSGRHSMPKREVFFLVGSVQLTHQAGMQALVLALWRWQHREKEQTARGHGTTENVHQPMFSCLAIVHFFGKNTFLFIPTSTLLSRRQVTYSFLRLQSILSWSAEGLGLSRGQLTQHLRLDL